ncbi:hypothetical protein AB1Y20_004390 [Prymnesium parvum]|uniref:Exostosin GT47 domain-containing protein n=1 Tax=Prymnesium parvum TaxID=97485 RepID=A0AB34IWR3_PRYPA
MRASLLAALLTPILASPPPSAREALLAALLPADPRPLACTRDHTRGAKLRLFVYRLPWAYSGQIVEYVEARARALLGVKCAYLREDSCPNTGFSHLENLRSHCTDVPLLYKLLQTAALVDDAADADVFLVPFLMGCNAMLGWGHGMQRVNAAAHHAFFGDFARFAREHLPFFARYPHRHLFLFPLDSMFAPKWLKHSMIAHTGAGYTSSAAIDVPVPYLVSLPQLRSAPADRDNFVFLMASPSRNPVRAEVARQLREAAASRAAAARGGIELYETDPRKENAMPLSARETMRRMRRSVFCVAPTGDSDGFTQRFYYILAAGCIPVRVDTYYSDFSFGRVAWPFKQTIEWRRAALLVPPPRLRRDGLLPILRNVSSARVRSMQKYIASVVRPSVLFDYRGTAPDAYSAFLDELLHLAKTKLPRLDAVQRGEGDRIAGKLGGRGGKGRGKGKGRGRMRHQQATTPVQ